MVFVEGALGKILPVSDGGIIVGSQSPFEYHFLRYDLEGRDESRRI